MNVIGKYSFRLASLHLFQTRIEFNFDNAKSVCRACQCFNLPFESLKKGESYVIYVQSLPAADVVPSTPETASYVMTVFTVPDRI
jgi:hypothetical protein